MKNNRAIIIGLFVSLFFVSCSLVVGDNERLGKKGDSDISDSDTTDSDTADKDSDTAVKDSDTADTDSDTTVKDSDTTDTDSDTTDTDSDTTDTDSDTTDTDSDTTDTDSDTTDTDSDTTDTDSDTTDTDSDTTDTDSDTTDTDSDTTDTDSGTDECAIDRDCPMFSTCDEDSSSGWEICSEPDPVGQPVPLNGFTLSGCNTAGATVTPSLVTIPIVAGGGGQCSLHGDELILASATHLGFDWETDMSGCIGTWLQVRVSDPDYPMGPCNSSFTKSASGVGREIMDIPGCVIADSLEISYEVVYNRSASCSGFGEIINLSLGTSL